MKEALKQLCDIIAKLPTVTNIIPLISEERMVSISLFVENVDSIHILLNIFNTGGGVWNRILKYGSKETDFCLEFVFVPNKRYTEDDIIRELQYKTCIAKSSV